MLLIFTKSSQPLSKLIRWGTDEPVSHFAIVFDDKLVFHSNLLGVHLEWFDTFKKHATIVYSISLRHTTLEEQEAVFRGIVDNFDGSKYDFKAFLYFAWRVFLRKCFNKELPKVNIWDDKHGFLCTELAKALPTPFKLDADLSIITPFTLWEIYKERLGKYYPISQ